MDKETKWDVFNAKMDNIKVVNITPAQFRELVLKRYISSGVGTNPYQMPSTRELDTISDMLVEAVTAGRFIDFGDWPNEFIKKQSTRASDLYYEGALGHPFSTPWVFYHTWKDEDMIDKLELDRNNSTSIYLVNPLLHNGKAVACDFEITALEPFSVRDVPILGVGDRGILFARIERNPGAAYVCNVSPVQFRFPQEFWDDYAVKTGLKTGRQAAMLAAAANIIEPAMTAMLLINTRGIPKETIAASDKLNRARIKNGKLPIPPYTKVKPVDYVAVAMRLQAKRDHQGGHHASPVTHIRMGHWRNYKSGERTFINDTLVKATPEMRDMFKSNRAGYMLRTQE
jgi:hypothetical protein